MGCDDYFDPRRAKEDVNWFRHTGRLAEVGYQRQHLAGGWNSGDFATCGDCAALLWIGDIRAVDGAMAQVEKHIQWHQERR